MPRGLPIFGDWDRLGSTLGRMSNPLVIRKAFDRAARQEAERIRRVMVQSFNRGGPDGAKWKPLAPFTQLLSRALGHGDRRPLLRTGAYRNAFAVHEVDGEGYFVGVLRTAKGPNGEDLINIAEAHEFGRRSFTMKVTPKMRAFFRWLASATGGQIKPIAPGMESITVGLAPPRPVVGPVWEAEQRRSADNMVQAFSRELLR